VNIILSDGDRGSLPNQLLTVRAQSNVAPPPRVEAVSATSTDVEITPADRAPGLVSLLITQSTVIRVSPPNGAPAFAPGAALTLLVGPDQPEADQLVLQSIDVSGLTKPELLHLEPMGDQVIVTALPTSDLPLPPLAHQARIAAREVLDTRRVANDRAVRLQVAVDGSASMRQHLTSPAVGQVLELVMGLGSVIASSPTVSVELSGQSRTRLPERSLTELAERVVADAMAVPPSIGFRSDVIHDAGQDGLTFLVTDAVPADLPADRADAVHLLIISAGGDEVAEPRPAGVGATVLDPPPDWQPSAPELHDLVGRLLSTYQQRRGAGAH
jgi:hypothetical protein